MTIGETTKEIAWKLYKSNEFVTKEGTMTRRPLVNGSVQPGTGRNNSKKQDQEFKRQF